MTTPRTRYNPPFTAHVVSTGALADAPFVLLDVGASGGVEPHWAVFGDHLIADGFEPLVAEVARLNTCSPSPRISYHAVRVVAPNDQVTRRAHRIWANPRWLRTPSPWFRTSAVRATELLKLDYTRTVNDPAGHGVMAESTTTLDTWYLHEGRGSVDFLKTDTDGHDYGVLRGAVTLLRECPVLGIAVEVLFHGPNHPHAETFSAVDRFLRNHGFSLLDLEVYRYSRAALPQPFAGRVPAETTRGQAYWGDAVYMRDAGDPEYEKRWGVHLTPHKLLKLACLYEVFGCEDCAAEVLLTRRQVLRDLLDIEHGLDLLTPPRDGHPTSYRRYLEQFEPDPTRWYPR